MIINSNVSNEIIINKSKFITYLYKVKNKDEFLKYYEKLKKQYEDATHICYAYIINNEIKYSDANEPNGSAGMPIYDVLKKNKLNYIACFVIRYFGGIKLGASGLVRAYSNSTSQALKKTNIIELEKLFKIEITTNYQEINLIENIINKEHIIEKTYKDNITFKVLVNDLEKNKLDNYNINYKILNDNYF
ncbi:MAG: YigZ family protein [Bacilli bacterium]|nr:YigZ family protein [Bacilli bacterium]